MNRREFVKGAVLFIPACGVLQALTRSGALAEVPGGDAYDPAAHCYGMGIEIAKCIGCNRCVEACKAENDVPREPYFFRTWVERYEVKSDGEAAVESISVSRERADEARPDDAQTMRSFFVPKLCNQCAHPPCVQVCPVGATFATRDGVVLVDRERCLGCRYCIQACPYGARYLDHRSNVADKCTFCYHRITQGLQPACVEVCPTQARVFGDLRSRASRLVRLQRMEKLAVLKPALNTEPKVYYAGLDGEVR